MSQRANEHKRKPSFDIRVPYQDSPRSRSRLNKPRLHLEEWRTSVRPSRRSRHKGAASLVGFFLPRQFHWQPVRIVLGEVSIASRGDRVAHQRSSTMSIAIARNRTLREKEAVSGSIDGSLLSRVISFTASRKSERNYRCVFRRVVSCRNRPPLIAGTWPARGSIEERSAFPSLQV